LHSLLDLLPEDFVEDRSQDILHAHEHLLAASPQHEDEGVISVPPRGIPQSIPDAIEVLLAQHLHETSAPSLSISSRALRCRGMSFIVSLSRSVDIIAAVELGQAFAAPDRGSSVNP
jgi:hypothetical protein